MISSKDSKINDWKNCERNPWKNCCENFRRNLWKKTQKISKKILEVFKKKIIQNPLKLYSIFLRTSWKIIKMFQEFLKKVTRSIREEVLQDFFVHCFSCSGKI